MANAKKRGSPINDNFLALKERIISQKKSAETVDNCVDNSVDSRVDNCVDNPVDNCVDNCVDNPVDNPVDSRVDSRVDNCVDREDFKLKLNKKEKKSTKKSTYYLQTEIAAKVETYAKLLGMTGSELANNLLTYALDALNIKQ